MPLFDLNVWKEKLKTSINTNEVKGNLENLEKDISRDLLPSLVSLNDITDGNYNSEFMKEYDGYFKDEFKTQKVELRRLAKPNILDYHISLLRNMLVVLPWLGQQFKSRTIHIEGMELRQSNLIQMAELCEFTVRYLTAFSDCASFHELNSLPGSTQKVGKLTPTQEEYVSFHRYTYVISMTILSRDLNQIKGAYGKIPALIADSEKYHELVETIGTGNADPLNLSAPPFPLSIVFYPQMAFANWQMDRLESIESTSKLVQYRILLLKRKREDGTGDANIEREIEIQEERLASIQRKIAKLETSYGLAGAA